MVVPSAVDVLVKVTASPSSMMRSASEAVKSAVTSLAGALIV